MLVPSPAPLTAASPHLDAGGWQLWRDFVLRSTGISIEALEALEGARRPGALLEVAELPEVHEAMAWQNRPFRESAVEWLRRNPEARNHIARRLEHKLLLYVQRLSTKNETIGFFGAPAWGRMADAGPDLTLETGPQLVVERRVEWENWAIAAFARRWQLPLRMGLADTSPERMAEALVGAPPEAQASWQELEASRRRLAEAAGEAAAVEHAMAALEEAFVAATGSPAVNAPGQMMVARTVARERCRRAASLTLGPSIWRKVASGLGWLFSVQRWVSERAAAVWQAQVERNFAGVAVAGRAELSDLFPQVAAICEGLGATRVAEVHAITAEARRRVEGILQLPPGVRVVERSAAELEAAVAAAFEPSLPGWGSAELPCPDMMIAPTDAGPQLVLGELHSARNTLDISLFTDEHPDPQRLSEWLRADLGEDRVHRGADSATPSVFLKYPRRGEGVLLDLSGSQTALPAEQVLTLSDLELRASETGLRVVSRKGRHEWPLLRFLDPLLGGFGAMLLYIDHMPRLVVDGVVVARESWLLGGPDLSFATEPTAASRFARLQRLAARLGLPRYLFCHLPNERKPIFVDRQSELFAELLARLARGKPWIRVVEMLPTPEQCWLTDAAGRRYTSETRMAFVDPLRPPFA